ncbi:MAG TPA: DUF2269 family protein [Anaerolineae bacterium]|jgi:Predicted integral membrane protein (DUF2269)|nr:DUF2269 family protein [Anaerolineae bacterium]
MNVPSIFKFLHILSMFAGVGASTGTLLLVRRVARTNNATAIKTLLGAARTIIAATPILFGIGAIFGLLTGATSSFDFFKPWLLIAYTIFVVLLVVGARISAPWAMRVGKAAAMNQGDAPSAELQAATADQSIDTAFWITMVLLVVVIFDMIFKPFGI